MSRRPDPWSPCPREAAHAWSTLSFYDRMVGQYLTVALGSADGPVPGELESVIAHALRGAANGRDRQHLKRAIQRIRARGFLFEHEGNVYLLYSETLWRKYRALSDQYAEKKPILTLVRSEAAAPPASERHAHAERTSNERRSDIEATSKTTQVLVIVQGTHPTERQRERETEREDLALVCAPPAAASPPTGILPITKTRKRSRRDGPLDVDRRRAIGIFNEEYQQRYPGCVSTPARQDLATRIATAYRLEGGRGLDEDALRASVRAHLEDAWWTSTRPGYSSPPGHSFDHWAKKHERYDQAARMTRIRRRDGWEVAVSDF